MTLTQILVNIDADTYTLERRADMAFVNEYVSEEDIKKHDLDGLIKSYNLWSWKDGRAGGFIHTWTIDRERDIYFLSVKDLMEVGPSGLAQYEIGRIFVLSWQGQRIVITLEKSENIVGLNVESPKKIIWGLVDIKPAELPGISHEEILLVVKDALTTYGAWGAHRQARNTIVEFKF